jgi:hypothetical protein
MSSAVTDLNKNKPQGQESRYCALISVNNVPIIVPGSLETKGGRRCHLSLNKRWNLLLAFLSNEPGTGGSIMLCGSSFFKDKFSAFKD